MIRFSVLDQQDLSGPDLGRRCFDFPFFPGQRNPSLARRKENRAQQFGLFDRFQQVTGNGKNITFALTQFRQHNQTVLAAVFAPLIAVMANLFYVSPINPSPWLDLTAIGFVAGILILEKGILQEGVLKTLPVVRERVVEHRCQHAILI